MNNSTINKIAIKKIAQALGELNEKVIYVGGAVVSLYIDDEAADDIRATKDIDISVQIASLSELEALREELLNKGFSQSSEDDVICRFRYYDIKVDVMNTKAIGWAPANPWFEPGFKYSIQFDIDGISIKCLSLPYFLATKFTAFEDRGASEPRFSHDFEDIVYLLNHTSNLKEQIQKEDFSVKKYLKNCFLEIIKNRQQQEAILGNLFHEDQDYRYNKIITYLKDICQSI
jgi:predicted nucleotidyltransferase